MEVFLVPVGPDRHALYCEHAEPEPATTVRDAPRSIRRRLADIFHRALTEGEAERERSASAHPPPQRGRLRPWIAKRLAEAVAEQRLLWHLRRKSSAVLVHPDDLSESHARDLARGALEADLDKHRRWCAIDAAVALACAPLTVIPGPNLPAYYFVFRAVGHWLSMRGAQHGLSGVDWSYRPSAPLTALRIVDALDAEARSTRVGEVGAALGLERLARLVDGASAREV